MPTCHPQAGQPRKGGHHSHYLEDWCQKRSKCDFALKRHHLQSQLQLNRSCHCHDRRTGVDLMVGLVGQLGLALTRCASRERVARLRQGEDWRSHLSFENG